MAFNDEFLSKEVEKKEREAALFESIRTALRTEERFVNYFRQFDPASVNQFIDHYAQRKVYWLTMGKGRTEVVRTLSDQERKRIVGFLAPIMEKKVFNLQCRWVAGEMDLEGVQLTIDFTNWRHQPAILREVGPITEAELLCYLDHWNESVKDEDEYTGDAEGWQALQFYHLQRAHVLHDAGEQIPEWFHAYDRSFGTAHLMHLPNTRTDLEADHQFLWARHIHWPTLPPEQQARCFLFDRAMRLRAKADPEYAAEMERQRKALEPPLGPSYRHFSTLDHDTMLRVVNAIETPAIRMAYEKAHRYSQIPSRFDVLYNEREYLKEVQEPVPVKSADDFQVAIHAAYVEHRHRTDAEAIRSVYESYRRMVDSGAPFVWDDMHRTNNTREEMDRYITVRKHLGLSPDLSFLHKANLP